MNRLNTVGAVYLLFVALIPTVLIMALGLNAKLPFGGTTILIIAGVGLDTLRQAKAQTEQFQYTGFLLENVESGTKSLPSTVGGSMSDWRKSAACAGYDPALWFPGNSQLMRREAIHICHTCPVMMQCRKYAETNIDTPVVETTGFLRTGLAWIQAIRLNPEASHF